jgi:hypothetical protein
MYITLYGIPERLKKIIINETAAETNNYLYIHYTIGGFDKFSIKHA